MAIVIFQNEWQKKYFRTTQRRRIINVGENNYKRTIGRGSWILKAEQVWGKFNG